MVMARAWLIDSRGLAKKVKNSGGPCQIKDCSAQRQCPNCHYVIDNSDVSQEWPGLPIGVKFVPSDVELLDHLAAKCGIGDLEPHLFIDDFIPTLEGHEGICYTHPENLPGAKRDGSSIHFFYRITNAYASGHRKRRRIRDHEKASVRWHKTGKTKPVVENGVLKGYKKIMVLYSTSKSRSKSEKCNWAMHQYHLGEDEDEKEGQYVVSKVFYQLPKEATKDENSCLAVEEESDDIGTAVKVVPQTPKTITPDPPRPQDNTPSSDYVYESFFESLIQEPETHKKPFHSFPSSYVDSGNVINSSGSNALLCKEYIGSYNGLGDVTSNNNDDNTTSAQVGGSTISDLDNIELDTPPDFQLSDLQFASLDSVFDWFDRF